jgi:GPH family glycoside/pentoside/hexuronide:cation symporter
VSAGLQPSPAVEVKGPVAEDRVPLGTIVAYNAPPLGLGFMFFLVSLYMMKYSTDVLLISPAAIGLIFGLSRIWDAISDPMAGYFSDRTRSKLGRRRPWMLAAIVPIVVSYILMWNPPASFQGGALIVWMALAVFAFYTAMTILVVPHASLGAELSKDYHERTRIFGIRQICWGSGSLLSLVGMFLLIRSGAPRETALQVTVMASSVTALLILLAVVRLRERPEYQGRGAEHPYSAYRDVSRNSHARILLATFLIENVGVSSLATMTPFVIHYIVKRPELTPVFISCYMIPSLLSVPLWIRLSRHFGKKQVWIFAMLLTGCGFGGMFFMDEGTIALVATLTIIAGIGGGCGPVIAPSVQADVIDYDEWVTGERKEGAYFASFNFMFKSSAGLTLMLVGFVLSLSGFEPNQEQTETVKLVLRIQFAIFPLVCYAIGASILSRFALDEEEHGRIRAQLDKAGPGSSRSS